MLLLSLYTWSFLISCGLVVVVVVVAHEIILSFPGTGGTLNFYSLIPGPIPGPPGPPGPPSLLLGLIREACSARAFYNRDHRHCRYSDHWRVAATELSRSPRSSSILVPLKLEHLIFRFDIQSDFWQSPSGIDMLHTWVQKRHTVFKRCLEAPHTANWPQCIICSGAMCPQIKHVRFWTKKLTNFKTRLWTRVTCPLRVLCCGHWAVDVSRVHKPVLKLVNFLVQNLLKPYMFDLGTHSTWIYDALWSICSIGGL